MNKTLKEHLARQLVADEDRMMALSLWWAAGDKSAKQEIDELEQAIQVKIALISGMKEE